MNHKVKLLISALPAVGKTTLLSTLEDVLVIARDGKAFPFEMPHVNVPDFTDVDQLINLIIEKINAYDEKYGKLPKIVAIDSISKIVLDIEGCALEKVKAFPYGVINTEIKKLMDFIERDLVPEFDVILVSHAMYSEEVGGYVLVNAGGSYGKKGGILSEVDEAIFLELKGKNRNIYYRNPKVCARTTIKDLPDSVPITEFNLQKHVEILRATKTKTATWSL